MWSAAIVCSRDDAWRVNTMAAAVVVIVAAVARAPWCRAAISRTTRKPSSAVCAVQRMAEKGARARAPRADNLFAVTNSRYLSPNGGSSLF